MLSTPTATKLGYDLILEELARRTLSGEAEEKALALKPGQDPELLLPELKRVNEYREILLFDDPFPLSELPAVAPLLKKAQLAGNWLSLAELYAFLVWLRAIKDARAYLKSRKEKYPGLYAHVYAFDFDLSLIKELEQVVDERGNLRDNASTELQRIRKEQQSTASELRITLNRILRKAVDQKWSEASEITIRNDRLVIPVKADAKGRIPGFVQDVSSSGNTVFIEPAESLGLNNQLRELQIREHNEIVRILMDLTAKVRPHLGSLEGFHETMVLLDLIRAKAKLAVDLKAVLPVITPNGTRVVWREARYPLLVLRARTEKFPVVALDLTLEEDKRIVVISGPNAGGKSVSLKTVGLLQAMLQSGLLVPVDERSEFRFFDSLFVAIGDEQSVESDLSTYTSHLYQLRQMGDRMTQNSLFLIDEFGSGTDPQLGGAIAEAFLERFVRQGAYGIITTHYGNIKEYAAKTEGVGNAAMEFDTQELKPTYKLIDGLPGRSYAFEIAKRVGVHFVILRQAKRKLGRKQLSSEQLLSQLESKNQELEQLVEENREKEMRLKRLVEQNEDLQEKLEASKRQILRDAQLEAKQLIQDANRRIEQTIRQIKEKQAEKEETKRLRQLLEAATPEVLPAPDATMVIGKEKKKKKALPKPEGPRIIEGELPVEGDYVKLKNSDSYGRLVELQGKRATVEVGEMRLTVKLNQLQKVLPPKEKKVATSSMAFSRPITKARTELDVMGMRVEEALVEVEKFLDEALLNGLTYFRILHGKGSGALRDGIRSLLKGHPAVVSLADATLESGGDGWTVVELKN